MEWSISDGLRRVIPTQADAVDKSTSLAEALRFIRQEEGANIYVLKDALRYVGEPANERLLRDLGASPIYQTKTVFMIDAAGELPTSLQTLAVPYDLALPDEQEILDLVRETARQIARFEPVAGDLTGQDKAKFLANLRGLTRMEIAQVVADAILKDGRLDKDAVGLPIEVKQQRLRQTGVLDFIPPPEVTPAIGGMENLRSWMAKRENAWSPEARQFGLEPPKGILMLGVQGCGKSLMARFVAAQWKMPLLRMDVGSLYDKYVGETERHLRMAFKYAAAMTPCVLWIDEIEKAFASAGAGLDGARSDGGLSQRMFGMLLTWMQDHKEQVFIVATANDVTAMPPELMRKGRFDEVFFVDLPDAGSRRDILTIHLKKRQRDPARFDLDGLVAASDGFSGAELEQAVVSGMYSAFAEKRDLSSADLLAELRATRPLSVLMAEKVQELRDWAKDRCVPAD
jgi:SpoVK/Ycf46/Vps4 family AAA+-type ATPase